MKKYFILLSLFFIAAFAASAQITEGKVTYSMDVISDKPDMDAAARLDEGFVGTYCNKPHANGKRKGLCKAKCAERE